MHNNNSFYLLIFVFQFYSRYKTYNTMKCKKWLYFSYTLYLHTYYTSSFDKMVIYPSTILNKVHALYYITVRSRMENISLLVDYCYLRPPPQVHLISQGAGVDGLAGLYLAQRRCRSKYSQRERRPNGRLSSCK